jgi:hypothetical protein
MPKLRQLLHRARDQARTIGRFIQQFYKDTSKETYEQLTKRTATAILMVLLAIALLLIGPDLIQRGKELLTPPPPPIQRQINGLLTDAHTGLPIEDALVQVAGQLGAETRTDSAGLFRIRFQAHPDSTHIRLSFNSPGYAVRLKRHPIPLDPPAEAARQYFTLEKLPPD